MIEETGKHKKRIQLTLFIEAHESASIEKIRRTWNPCQYALIKSHVTLCREDELEQIEKVMSNLTNLTSGYIIIGFGDAIRFSDGKGVLIPAIGDNEAFHYLRARILQEAIEKPRRHEPHITLIHPRNGECTDDIFQHIKKCTLPHKIVFPKISLIEQEAGKPWVVLKEFELKK